jgi:hypothetical protein
VLCPLCKKTQLKQYKTVIVCTCGDFRFDTKDDQVNRSGSNWVSDEFSQSSFHSYNAASLNSVFG